MKSQAEKHELMVIEKEHHKGILHEAVVGLLTLAPLILIAIGISIFVKKNQKDEEK